MLPSMRPARRILYRGVRDAFFGDDENAQVSNLRGLARLGTRPAAIELAMYSYYFTITAANS